MALRHLLLICCVAALVALALTNGCKDIGSEPSFGVTQKNVSLGVGGSLAQTISGGTPPYSILSNGDTTKASVTISGTLLTIRGVATGSSTIIIADNSIRQQTDLINVSISTGFAGQIQPIFTTNCVNHGCHPGGSAPFSLMSGVSYNNLVNQSATIGSCAGVFFRVKPFSADSSALFRRISGTTCGVQMPFDGPPYLSTSDQNLIRDWINQGAQNN